MKKFTGHKKEPDSEEGYEASSEKGDPKDEIEEEREKIEAAKKSGISVRHLHRSCKL